jgi:hypothetical protein
MPLASASGINRNAAATCACEGAVNLVFGERMCAYCEGFVSEEARSQGFTRDDPWAWRPPATAAKRGRRKAGIQEA